MYFKKQKSFSNTVTDTELGVLSFDEYGDAASYSCKVELPISLKAVDVFFDTPSKERLPTDQQKQFLKNIIENYGRLIEKTIPIISTTEAQLYLREKIINKIELRPVSILIPQVDTGAFKWDMTFEEASTKGIFIIVFFDNLTPLSSTIERDEKKPFTKFLLGLLNGRS